MKERLEKMPKNKNNVSISNVPASKSLVSTAFTIAVSISEKFLPKSEKGTTRALYASALLYRRYLPEYLPSRQYSNSFSAPLVNTYWSLL